MKPKRYQGDSCPECNKGTLEAVDMKGEEYLSCDKCTFTYFGEELEIYNKEVSDFELEK